MASREISKSFTLVLKQSRQLSLIAKLSEGVLKRWKYVYEELLRQLIVNNEKKISYFPKRIGMHFNSYQMARTYRRLR